MTVAPEKDFVSIGQLAAHLQRSVRAIERAMCETNVMPSMRQNGVPFFDANAVELLTAHLQRLAVDGGEVQRRAAGLR
jgi:hypothetical protein